MLYELPKFDKVHRLEDFLPYVGQKFKAPTQLIGQQIELLLETATPVQASAQMIGFMPRAPFRLIFLGTTNAFIQEMYPINIEAEDGRVFHSISIKPLGLFPGEGIRYEALFF